MRYGMMMNGINPKPGHWARPGYKHYKKKY